MTPTRIVVPVDLSEASRAGLRVARDIGRRFDAQLHVLHVEMATAGLIAAIGSEDPEGTAREHRKSVTARVEDFVRGTLGADHGAYVSIVEGLFVAEAIVDAARDHDWICLSATGRTGWRRLVLGSTAAEVVRRSPVPVLTLRGRTEDASDFMFDDFRRVLVALDLGEGSDRLVDTARAVAGPHGAVLVAHVIEVPGEIGLYGVPLRLPAENLEAAKEWTLGAIAKLTKDIDPHRVEEPRILAGRPAQSILALERELQPDVTVVGTHGRHGLDHLMLGSVAERVVRHAEGPVLVVPTRARAAS